jgi:hypothetical protein
MIDFTQYHDSNPQIWDKFVEISLKAKSKGFKNYSVNGIFEILRWETGVSGNDNFKINNNYRPDYARKLMAEKPEFKNFFRIRKIKAERK